MLRYAGEFNGVRIAAGIGYERVRDRQTNGTCFTLVGGANAAATCGLSSTGGNISAGPSDLTTVRPDVEAWGGGVSLLHVPTGLFVQGHYMKVEFDGGASGYWGQSVTNKQDANQWMLQFGITRNWFGIGNTAFYGEFSRSNDWGAGINAGRSYSAAALPGSTAVAGVTSTELNVWGLGVTQNLDAAATTLYFAYRNFEADIGCSAACTAGGTRTLNTEDFHAIIGGAVVRF